MPPLYRYPVFSTKAGIYGGKGNWVILSDVDTLNHFLSPNGSSNALAAQPDGITRRAAGDTKYLFSRQRKAERMLYRAVVA